ncbi:pre-rRNA processing protein Utp22 [Aspergillus eucalypticola CBS 122712]|uniref:U3 small nucleolar RNA-associated protein 22 n=1 Tax=Aspergillus eucalypticola (strain CBS 122712 / IBT 29274) TaxID=1448314 RepID=A0A317UZ54_ASPEC|nr:pre-rRNA processing protein Utp22 [Aspergillus eucalypticola CBS 122712]PWY66178.1 pre-rRNA processing protein Utp22 [Aspergillus eucalypticola CBS 122712]
MSAHTAKRRRLSPSPDDSSRTQNNSAYSVSNRNNLTDSDAAKPSRDVSTLRSSGRAKNDRSAELALASGFYKSTFFKLQLDELLNGSRPNYDKQVSRLQETLHKLKSVIECLPDRPPKSTFEAEKELRGTHGITVPFPEPRPAKDTKYTVSYSKPTNINVVGSLSLKTGAKSDVPLTVDLAVTMPSALFQEKDYVNYRYFHKRAYYIASLAAGIREAEGLNLTVKFGLQDGDSLRPVLLLEPNNGTERKESLPAKTQIRIITAIEDSLFPISRTLPSRNNIRQGSADVPVSQESTPFYNAALRSEATVAQYHKFLYNAARNCESFKDACILGRTWLRQRGLGSSPFKGGFGGFEWTVLMALLFEGGGPNGKPVLLKSYSSYQLFKATLQFIAGRDLAIPLLFSATDISFPDGTPVLYDGKRGLNVLYKMAPWSYAFLRREANTTVRMLNESRDDNFDKVFIIKVNEPLLRFDRILKLPAQDSANILRSLRSQTAVYDVIVRALGDRADLVHIYGDVLKPWPVDEKPHRKPASQSVSVGLVLSTDNAERVVDHGPSAEQKEEAAAFRSFWGEKAELRRFKDGTIRESLVWTDEKSSPSIVYQILTYILSRHFNYTKDDVVFIGDEYDDKLREGGDDVFSYSSPAFQAITDAFTSVQRSIQDMDGVPLTVRHLAPASPSLRYTALRLHGTAGVASNPADIVLQFESSARWPDDLKAIQMTKVAFLIKIGDSLKSGGVASACRVGLENESTGLMNNSFLDITHTSGIVFRLRIHHEREQLLLERQLKEKGASPLAKQQVAYALAAYKRLFIQTPRLTQAIRTLCTRFPLLSPTIRLVKYWFNCHLLAGHVNQELIELLVVRVFTQSYPWDSPSSVMAGFLRTLHVLARWDWQQEPLMVDFGELNKESMEAIQTRFSAWRSVDPAMNTVALFVASDIDTDGVTWTQHEMPPKVVAARMCTLAKAAMKLLREQGYGLTVSDLFHTSLAPYDFVINIRPGLLQERLALPTRFKNLDARRTAGTAKPAIVSSFARDLQACYHPNMLLFHGDESCSVIGGLWNPQILKPKKWTLKLAYSTCPSEPRTNEEVSMNCQAVLSEIARLGADLVDSIEVHTEVASEK